MEKYFIDYIAFPECNIYCSLNHAFTFIMDLMFIEYLLYARHCSNIDDKALNKMIFLICKIDLLPGLCVVISLHGGA